jgi:cystathionine beta-lyase/cystathionine gamma-synthase
LGEPKINRATEILYRGAHVKGRAEKPEVPPIYLATAFNVEDLDDLQSVYADNGYTYNRTGNPNRNTLAELMTYLENGEDSLIFSSGMAAISTAILALLESGDHILSDDTLFSETVIFISSVLPKYGIEMTSVDFTDLDAVMQAVKPNTKMLYTETVSNPMITVVDIEAIAKIAHANGAELIVDNTFTTSRVIRPLEKGADISINSLTKFANGHSDACVAPVATVSSIASVPFNRQLVPLFP